MLVWLRKAPATFQRAKNKILAAVRYHYALVYINDIAMILEPFNEQLRHIEETIGILDGVRTYIKAEEVLNIS